MTQKRYTKDERDAVINEFLILGGMVHAGENFYKLVDGTVCRREQILERGFVPVGFKWAPCMFEEVSGGITFVQLVTTHMLTVDRKRWQNHSK
jgi:hypothetical protein